MRSGKLVGEKDVCMASMVADDIDPFLSPPADALPKRQRRRYPLPGEAFKSVARCDRQTRPTR